MEDTFVQRIPFGFKKFLMYVYNLKYFSVFNNCKWLFKMELQIDIKG